MEGRRSERQAVIADAEEIKQQEARQELDREQDVYAKKTFHKHVRSYERARCSSQKAKRGLYKAQSSIADVQQTQATFDDAVDAIGSAAEQNADAHGKELKGDGIDLIRNKMMEGQRQREEKKHGAFNVRGVNQGIAGLKVGSLGQ